MKKYWVIFKNSMQTAMAYRFNALMMMFSESLSLAVMAYLWLSIYKQGGIIAGYSIKSLLVYYVLTKFISLTIKSSDYARIIGDQIRLGEVTNNLLKPISYLNEKFYSALGQITFRIIIYALIAAIVIASGINIFPSLAIFFYFLVSFALAIIIYFLIYYIIGISTFYFGYIVGFNFVMMGIISFFSGNLLPLDMLPAWLFNFASFLPFKYIDFVPISIATGRISAENLAPTIFFGLVWAGALYLAAVALFKQGVKKYEAFSI